MQWQSMSEFLNMGGYGLYVWTSFAVTFACMGIEVWLLHARKIRNTKGQL